MELGNAASGLRRLDINGAVSGGSVGVPTEPSLVSFQLSEKAAGKLKMNDNDLPGIDGVLAILLVCFVINEGILTSKLCSR